MFEFFKKQKEFYDGSEYHIHLGPGKYFKKNKKTICIDFEESRSDIKVNFNQFDKLPLRSNTISSAYASHVLEHISMYKIDKVLSEINRVLKKGAPIRIIIPDAVKSMTHYLNNESCEIFNRRIEREKNSNGKLLTRFECLKQDFISLPGQKELIKLNMLAHQNAWDFETISKDLKVAGFSKVYQSGFKSSKFSCFNFEGTFKSEANESERSLYIEAIK